MPIEERFHSGLLLSNYSTFGIGGPIRYYFEAKELCELEEALSWATSHSIPWFILGRGSNCLFDDRGFDGLVIHQKIDFCRFSEERVVAGAGMSFSLLGIQTAKRGLHGLEFASGIPASVGGAVYMNAGANKQETADVLLEVDYWEQGMRRTLLREQLQFSYRSSPFQSMKGCIVAATFQLAKEERARQLQLNILDQRMKTQPMREKSAGCVFRNPSADCSAGLLIERCGLKGVSVGGAQVSKIHANFIVNGSQATAADVSQLIELIQQKVFAETKIWLEPEIRKIPYVC